MYMEINREIFKKYQIEIAPKIILHFGDSNNIFVDCPGEKKEEI